MKLFYKTYYNCVIELRRAAKISVNLLFMWDSQIHYATNNAKALFSLSSFSRLAMTLLLWLLFLWHLCLESIASQPVLVCTSWGTIITVQLSIITLQLSTYVCVNDPPDLHTSMSGQESFTQESGCRDTVPCYAYEAQNSGACIYLPFKLVLGIFSALVSNMQTDILCTCTSCSNVPVFARGAEHVIFMPACVQCVVCFL